MAETFVYRHIWPIVDDDVPVSALTAAAGAEVSLALGRLGVRPTARPRFVVAEDRLVCEVQVLRLDGDDPAGSPVGSDVDVQAVLELVDAGRPDGHIAAELGCPRSEVERIRRELTAAM